MNSVIKPWLVASLTIALLGSALLSGVLIVKLSRFDEEKKHAEEVEALATKKGTELAALQVEVASLTKQKDALAPTVADWEKRLAEKAAAEATLATLQAKEHQSESDITRAGQRLDETTQALIEAEKQKTEISSTIDKLKSELLSVAKSNTDTKAMLEAAANAEHRLSDATNAFANIAARRKELEADTESAQTNITLIRKETDGLRSTREALTTDTAALRQQIQYLKDQLATLDTQAAEFKARQTALKEEELELTKVQQQIATTEARTAELETRRLQTVSAITQLTNRFELAKKETFEAEAQLEKSKSDLQLADSQLTSARKLSQEFSARQGELTREVSQLEASIERLKKEKESLEKEIGQLDSKQEKTQANAPK
ncbi:MAG TPA: hypothetical protein VG938_14445 [Verrucomicrobiae bacterium]|jgi:chromosome segregation protein|nr:hypothetical protein [Verrucomicrobiae bacterium]